MTQIDEFESLFKSADKPVFHLQDIQLKRVMIILDENAVQPEEYADRIKQFVGVIDRPDEHPEFEVVTGDRFQEVQELLARVGEFRPDLICTYRNLHIPATDHPYSLGVYVDVLTQASHIPVLLLPRPELIDDQVMKNSDRVMAVTDHLAGDQQLVTYAARFTQRNGQLTLAHIEDEQVFDRYMDVIGKIPSIDTDSAREHILVQLLKEPRDYIQSCQQEIQRLELPISVDSIVTVGHHLVDYKKLIDENQVDLLVINTKDDDQLAMHGMGYPLTVEIREIPLLLV